MEIVLSLKEAVFIKGTKKQQQQFEQKKRLSTDALKSLVRVFSEEYAKVEVIGRGKNRELILGERRQMQINLDNRKNNTATGRSTPFANQLDLLIVKALRDTKNRVIEGSVGNVMYQMNMANERLCYYRQPNRIDNYVADLERNQVSITKDWLFHVMDKEHDVLTGALLSSLRRLEKKKLLKWSKYPVGAVKIFNPEVGEFTKKPTVDNEDSPNGHIEYHFINLTNNQANELAEIERKLRKVHEVTSFQIVTYPYSEKVQRYKKDLNLEFQKKGINYYFDCFSIRLIATESDVDEQLSKNEWMIEENYIKKYFNYTIEKAEKRQEKYSQGTFGKPTELSTVKQKLSNKTYVGDYKLTLEHTVLPNEYTTASQSSLITDVDIPDL